MILARLFCACATRKGRASCRHNLHGAAAQGRGRCFAARKRGTGAGRLRECVQIGHKNDRNFLRESTPAPPCVARSACVHMATHTHGPEGAYPPPALESFKAPCVRPQASSGVRKIPRWSIFCGGHRAASAGIDAPAPAPSSCGRYRPHGCSRLRQERHRLRRRGSPGGAPCASLAAPVTPPDSRPCPRYPGRP